MQNSEKQDSEMVKIFGSDLLKHGFSPIPNFIEHNYRQLGLAMSEYALLRLLFSRWWYHRNLPWPSVSTLAKELQLSDRHVRRLVACLEQRGFLIRIARKNGHGGRSSNGYDMHPFLRVMEEFQRNTDRKYYSPLPQFLSFEPDDVFWDAALAQQKALALIHEKILLEFNIKADTFPLPQFVQSVQDLLHSSFLYTYREDHKYFYAFANILKTLKCDDKHMASKLAKIFIRHRNAAIQLYPDVTEVLSILKQSFKLALVTNHPLPPELYDLTEYFDFTFYGQDHQEVKFLPSFYETLLAQLKLNPIDIIHIGSSLQYDIAASHHVNIRSIWLNKHQQTDKSTKLHLTEIKTLDDLLNLPIFPSDE